jgi:uncharacterized protein YbjT (DUF2867 family)
MSRYSLLVTLHVASVIVWLGSGTTLAFLTIYARRARDAVILERLGALVQWMALRVFAPASLAAAGFGAAAAHAGHWPDIFFFHVGEGAFLFSFLLTVTIRLPLLRRAGRGMVHPARLSLYLLALSLAELTVLYLAVADMVVKPSGSGTSVVRYGGVVLALGLLAAAVVAYRARRIDPAALATQAGVSADSRAHALRRSSTQDRSTGSAPRPTRINHEKEDKMKIVVIGGSGLIGSKLVELLREAGHDPLAASPDSGVDALTGDGLAEAFAGAQVVVDVANAPAWEDAAVLNFFQTTTRNILAAEAEAGVKHHVALSIVGADRLPDSGYLRAKVAQEDAVKAGAIPYTIVRATQFFEFIGRIADSAADGETIRLAPVLVQPEAAADVSATLADVATSPPVNGIVELGGAERLRLDELARRVLDANNDPREVVADVHARYFGTELDDHSLTTGSDARIAPTRFEDWLTASLRVRSAA